MDYEAKKEGIILFEKDMTLDDTLDCGQAFRWEAIPSDYFRTYKGYFKMSPTEQAKLKMSYIQTTFAVYELIKLDHEVKNGNIKVKEVDGMRKDRYSSIAYSYWCACQLELKLKPKQEDTQNLVNLLPIKQGYRNR